MRRPSGNRDEKRIQEAFDAAALDLGLALEHGSFTEGEHYGVGFIPIIGRKYVATVPELESPPPIDDDDTSDIENVVNGWESLHPDDLLDAWQNYVTDPFVLVEPDGVLEIRGNDLKKTDQQVETMEQYPIYKPRRVTLSNFQVVFVGNARAGVTATIEEQLQDANVMVTNIADVLIKTAEGWRIAVITKETHH